MEEILAMATMITPVTWGVLQAVKKGLKIKERYLPLLAMCLGALLGAAAFFLESEVMLRIWAGGISGLAATGLFELGKNFVNGDELGKTACVVCGKEVEILEEFNGEMMCQDCYHDPDNEVFTDEEGVY